MRNEDKTLLFVGGAVVLAAMVFRRATHSPADDTDALTRMLIAETGFNREPIEMAQIVYVALNRARKWGIDPTDVVAPGKGHAPIVWNTGAPYRTRFENARSSSKWAQARAFVERVQGGAYTNYGATLFVHPGGMPKPPCESNRTSTETIAGTRCLPEWAVNGRVVGGAMFA